MSKNKRKMEDSRSGRGSSFTDVDKVASALKREWRFFAGIERLTDALEELDNFLEDASEETVEEATKESAKSWFEETKDEPDGVKGYVREDCVTKLSRLLQERRVVDFLSRAGQRFSELNSSRNVASSDIENSKALPLDEEEEEETSGTGFAERRNRKLFYSFLEEYVDSAAKEVTERLLEGTPSRSVISLVGPGGMGKTILARKVYESEMTGNHFDCVGWIDVSGSYDLKEILKAMITQIARAGQRDDEGLVAMRRLELVGALRQSLQLKRYMFVFDDVCEEDFWNVVRQALPENERGSRIIVTTRSEKVVDSCRAEPLGHVHKLEPLSDALSWDLFCRLAFQDEPERRCPTELEHLSIEFLERCHGFPLPIVALAGLLSTKDGILLEWKKLFHNFRREFQFNSRPPGALDVLTLSFRDLPNHLRLCFLYFIMFPEESLISTHKLFKLWIAEGFVEEKRKKTLTEVAEEYLKELIRRDLVKPYQNFCGLEQFCQVQKLVHNMAHVKAHELSFCLIRDNNNSNFRQHNLRLSIYNAYNALETIENAHVRAIFLFNIGALQSSFMITLIKECELLTLLDLENVPIEDLPEELGNLFHLKYLSLKNTQVKKLPESFGKLHKLQTLDLRNTLLTMLPLEISELRSLQHLLASVYDSMTSGDSTRGVKMMGGLRWLEKLHTLMTVDARLGGIGLLEELAKLWKLRRLSISGLTAAVGPALCTAIDELIHLETLSLQAKKNELLKLQTILKVPLRLKCLVLKGRLQKFPYLIIGLPSLTTLCLSLSKLKDIPLRDLSQLPNLVSLWLYQAFAGENLYFKKSGFERLKLLVLRDLQGLNAVEIEEGALPRLEELRIGSSPLMNEVPLGIEHLRNLKVLANYDMPSEFVLSIQPHCSEHWKVEHIASVIFWYRVHGRSYKLYKLGDSDLLDQLQGLTTDRDVVPHHQHEFEASFCDSDDEEDDDDDVDRLSFSRAPTFFHRNVSFSSGFYTDDLEE